MALLANQSTPLNLSELCSLIGEQLHTHLPENFWVRAEISELNMRHGHCYMELLEKAKTTGLAAAKMRATCWANVYAMLSAYFETETGQTLHVGMQVLLSVTVEFHQVYGISLNVNNIDPSYTLGDLARQRQETLAQLQADGIMDMNKALVLSSLPKRIAVISANTAAGYGDFCNQLNSNRLHFNFQTQLFPAIVQGERAESSIIAALEKIYEQIENFDAVTIIRGGGASIDLACFDSYLLASNCAQFPLPIVAGIGHQRDVSVLDMVAHTSVKTPTAAADFFINCMNEQAQAVEDLQNRLQQTLNGHIALQQNELSNLRMRLKHIWHNRIAEQQTHLDVLQKTLELHSPKHILKLGYTLTLLNGKPLTSAKSVKKGDGITTEFGDGKVQSIVE